VAPGQTVRVSLAVPVTDDAMIAAVNTREVTEMSDSPTITLGATLFDAYLNVPIDPFTGVAFTDPNVGATETVTVTLANIADKATPTDSNGTLALAAPVDGVSLTHPSAGTYTLTGSAIDVTAALQDVTFTPLPPAGPNTWILTDIDISVADGIAPPVAAPTILISAGLPIILGAEAGQTTADTAPIAPFSTVSITDSAQNISESVTIFLGASPGAITSTAADGTLSGIGLTSLGFGQYTLAAGTPSQVTAVLDALVFTPTANQVPAGQSVTTYFDIEVFNASTGVDNDTTSVVATNETPPCFAAGTRIATPRGDVPVEALKVGEMVVCGSGELRPIIWIGHRRVYCDRHANPRRVWPVHVLAGAFGDGLPRRRLVLSPAHAVFVDEVLIPVWRLINGVSIVQVPVEQVTYYHVELPEHDVLLAEGLASESYLDTGERDHFDNAGPVVRLHPNFRGLAHEARRYAELIVFGPKLETVRSRIMALAQAVPQRRPPDRAARSSRKANGL
jgi:hypothetical protein